MSVRVMSYVFDLDIPPHEKFVLLAYADHADHDGGSVYPSIATIARKTSMSERTVQRITRALEEKGYLIPCGGQKGGRNISAHWSIPMIKGDNMTPIIETERVTPVTERVTSMHKRVTPMVIKGDTAMSPEPSLTIKNHQLTINNNNNVFRKYESEIGVLTSKINDELQEAEKEYPEEWILQAIDEAARHNKRNLAYIQAILRNRKNGNVHVPKKYKDGKIVDESWKEAYRDPEPS